MTANHIPSIGGSGKETAELYVTVLFWHSPRPVFSKWRRAYNGRLVVKVKQSHYRPGQTQRVLRKLRFPDFVTTAQDGGRLSALRTGRLYSQEILLVLISVRD